VSIIFLSKKQSGKQERNATPRVKLENEEICETNVKPIDS
jgi:hypothetical protein